MSQACQNSQVCVEDIPFKGTLIPDVKFNWTLSDRDNDIWQQIGNTRLDLRYTQRLSVLLQL